MQLNQENGRIYALDEGGRLVAEITFPTGPDGVPNIDHTFVDASLRGQGMAEKLVRAALTQLRENGQKATASCSYARRWFGEHPEEGDILLP